MRRLGISDEYVDNEKRSLLSISYTNYMLSKSLINGLDIVIISLLSCAWTYAEIAKKIDKNNPKAKNHKFFGQWFKEYLSDDFQYEA